MNVCFSQKSADWSDSPGQLSSVWWFGDTGGFEIVAP